MKNMLVVATKTDDVIYSCGGSISNYIQNGNKVHVIILKESPLIEREKKALNSLGVEEVIFHQWKGSLLNPSAEELELLATDIRRIRPSFIVTHDKCKNLYNPNHDLCRSALMQAYQIASGGGAYCNGEKISPRQTPTFGFEPVENHTEFKPKLYLDITPSFDKKILALSFLNSNAEFLSNATKHWEYRANECVIEQPSCKYAESFSFFAPIAGHGFFIW